MAKKPLGWCSPTHHRRDSRGTVAVQVPRRAHFADSRIFVNGGDGQDCVSPRVFDRTILTRLVSMASTWSTSESAICLFLNKVRL